MFCIILDVYGFIELRRKKRRAQAYSEGRRAGGVKTCRERTRGEDMRIPPQCFGGINILLIFTMPEVPAGMPVSAEPM